MNRLLLIFLLFSNTLFAQVNLNLGLRAYYPFSGNANDMSGNNNNPVFNNALLTTDQLGNLNSAYHFNGTSSYMKIPDHPSLRMTNKMSLAAWVRPTGYYTGTCYQNIMVMKADVNNLPTNYFLNFGDVYTGCSTPTTATERFTGNGVVAPTPLVQLNRWYSVVWTSDGIHERLYVDCELKATSPVSGAAYSNTKDLFFGHQDDVTFPYWLNGDLDEIRIYDRELNADEVKAYGGCLATTTGPNIGGIINNYTPVLALNPCENKITVEDGSTFNVGDTVLMIQMKGAIIDSAEAVAFGTITDYRNAGNYEFNYVKSRSGNIIELKNTLVKSYNIPDGKVQLVRVPYYQSPTITSTLTCLPWDGSKGGILVLNARDTVYLNATIDVSGKGFRGGIGFNSNSASLNCFKNNYHYPQTNNADAGQKGESIAIISPNINYGKGASANGGGGGLGHNSGGGGGSNTGAGGLGGYQLDNCGNSPFDNRGIGGKALTTSTALNRIFLGGGGGAGQADNPGNIVPNGGNGGGIILLLSDKLKTNGNKILSNGDNAVSCSSPPSTDCHDGMGGGGAGGSLLFYVNQFLDNTATENKGGKGADMTGNVVLGGRIGGGGGGGGGPIFIRSSTLPANVFNINAGGANGVLIQDAGSSWGATPGQNGTTVLNLNIPVATIPFKSNIDSVRIRETFFPCDSFDFSGLAYTNTHPIAGWNWLFGDGGTASTQNTGHRYAPGPYTVKLVVTDINGCKDSTTKDIIASFLNMDAGPADTICFGRSTVLQATSAGATQFAWTPTADLDNASMLNPTATPPVTTMYYLNATNNSGCSRTDSALITVRSPNGFSINPPVDVCPNQPAQLFASGGDLYSWQPAAALNDPTIFNPIATPSATTPYTVIINDTLCGYNATLSTIITALPLPNIRANRANDIDCAVPQTYLIASGGTQYSWSPAATLNNPNSASPLATPLITTQYVVTGTSNAGCVNYDSVTVNVSKTNKTGYAMPTGFTPNNDGLNDCYGIKYWGTITELEFSIYNRWGERIFYTTKPGDCWDGRYKGITQDPAVFVYMIKAKTTCEPLLFRKGTFALIR